MKQMIHDLLYSRENVDREQHSRATDATIDYKYLFCTNQQVMDLIEQLLSYQPKTVPINQPQAANRTATWPNQAPPAAAERMRAVQEQVASCGGGINRYPAGYIWTPW